MRILIHQDAASIYARRANKYARPSGPGLVNHEFYAMLKAVEGQWLEVETDHLFDNQFNTVPIPGVTELGLRVMIESVAAIEDDVRHGVLKCNWCGGYDRSFMGSCDKCGKHDHLEVLKVVSPKLPNPTADAHGVKENT